MVALQQRSPLGGTRLPGTAFRVEETDASIFPPFVWDVLDGRLAAYRVRHFIPADDCATLSSRFWESPGRVPRPGEGEGGVEGQLLGASHIGKTSIDYLEEASACEPAVRALCRDAVDPIARLKGVLSADRPRLSVRAASAHGMKAGEMKAVCWSGLGRFVLEPHEDVSQLSDPMQAGFEIQQVKRVMAINGYVQVPRGGGQMQIWNIEPDHDSKERLGLQYTGFPYPADLLPDESLIIPVETGDLCLINGNLIHGVLRGDESFSSRSRLLLTCFSGFNERHELIWWT